MLKVSSVHSTLVNDKVSLTINIKYGQKSIELGEIEKFCSEAAKVTGDFGGIREAVEDFRTFKILINDNRQITYQSC
jgi:hypothetical protein